MSVYDEWIGSDYKSVIVSSVIIKGVEKELEQNPYDIKTWDIILQKVQDEDIENVRILYEMLIDQFPSYGRYWKCYIKHELDSSNYQRVGKLFKRCFARVMNIDLFEMFILYVKKSQFYSNLFTEKLAVTYKFGMQRVGMDINSYPHWRDYIYYLRNARNSESRFLRANFDPKLIGIEALGYPMNNIQDLWEDYRSFGTKDMNELAANAYWKSLRVLGDYQRLMESLNRDAPPLPIQNSPEERIQVVRWREYIAWEISDPLAIKNTRFYYKRVQFAYKQCLSCLWHHPDIWIEYALFLEQGLLEKTFEARGVQEIDKEIFDTYDMAIILSQKNSMLLHFAYADFEEDRKNHEKVHGIYNKLITNKDIDPTLTYIQYMKYIKRSTNNVSSTFLEKIHKDPRSTYHIRVAEEWIAICERNVGSALKVFEDGVTRFCENEEINLPRYLSAVTGEDIECFIEQNLSDDTPFRQLYNLRSEILKFERDFNIKDERRPTLLVELKECKGTKSAFLVDRYSFLDLMPCTEAELKSIG